MKSQTYSFLQPMAFPTFWTKHSLNAIQMTTSRLFQELLEVSTTSTFTFIGRETGECLEALNPSTGPPLTSETSSGSTRSSLCDSLVSVCSDLYINDGCCVGLFSFGMTRSVKSALGLNAAKPMREYKLRGLRFPVGLLVLVDGKGAVFSG